MLSLDAALSNDAGRYYYSTLVTYLSGVSSIKTRHYSWAVVKFYYSIFYSLRSWLAINGDCLFYFEKTPFLLTAQSGESPVRKNGPSHDILVKLFVERFSSNYFSTGEIDLMPAFDWLKSKREEVNYRTERFLDPAIPSFFQCLKKQSLRRLLEEYVSNTSYQWEFDPDHAVVALPFKLLLELKSKLADKGVELEATPEERAFLRKSASDSSGPIAAVLRATGVNETISD